MNRTAPKLASLLPLLLACRGAEGEGEYGATETETTETGPGDEAGESTSGETGTDGGVESDSTDSGGSDSGGSDSGESDSGESDSTTGLPPVEPFACDQELSEGLGFCYLTDYPEPWFELYQFGEIVFDGDILQLQCGGQGTFMFELFPAFGGFVPESAYVGFRSVLDVEAFNLGPTGFLADRDACVLAECCPLDGCGDYYFVDYVQMWPSDLVGDMALLHQQPGIMTVTMYAPGGPIERSWEVELSAIPDMSWDVCLAEEPKVMPLQLRPGGP